VEERRSAQRIPLEIHAAIECEGRSAHGWLCDFSATGARVEYSGLQPPAGASVRVTFCPSPNEENSSFDLHARVVRATEFGGFAVRFEAADPRLKRELARLAEHIAELPSV
jgi:c-di-GMP-binding flagellar brake protein YcgR